MTATIDILRLQAEKDKKSEFAHKIAIFCAIPAVIIMGVLGVTKIKAGNILKKSKVKTISPFISKKVRGDLVYTLKNNENLFTVKNKFHVAISTLMKANANRNVTGFKAGEKIIIPVMKIIKERNPAFKLASRGFAPSISILKGKHFNWPTASEKPISSGFGYRENHMHTGVDIPGRTGTAIFAAQTGKVELADWNEDYGECVILDHGNGIKTLYGHASKLLVKSGEIVQKGDTIAEIGNTGRSTGSHVHFEIIVNGIKRDPENFLNNTGQS